MLYVLRINEFIENTLPVQHIAQTVGHGYKLLNNHLTRKQLCFASICIEQRQQPDGVRVTGKKSMVGNFTYVCVIIIRSTVKLFAPTECNDSITLLSRTPMLIVTGILLLKDSYSECKSPYIGIIFKEIKPLINNRVMWNV